MRSLDWPCKMTLPAKSPPSCSTDSIDGYATYLEIEMKDDLKEEIKKENREDIEEEIEEEIKEGIEEEPEEETEFAEQRNKDIKVTDESTDDETAVETVEVADKEISDDIIFNHDFSSAAGNVKCSHPVVIKNKCSHCDEAVQEEIGKLRKGYPKDLLKDKKLILVLDLDYTLLNSAKLTDLIPEEEYLLDKLDQGEDDMNQTLFELDRWPIPTKLRPFIHTFLKEANDLFEMYIYTMGDQRYAMACANLLDPRDVYFPSRSRVICRSHNTTKNQKGLDVVPCSESLVIILDDTKKVWQKHKENLILMKRYHFFAYGARDYHTGSDSLSELMEDENESDGILASILNVLKRAHELFFDPESNIDLPTRDVRQILQVIKKEILKGCNIVFSEVFPSDVLPEEQPLWKSAEDMGAKCFAALNDSVTHVVAKVPITGEVEWARENNKFVVTPQWIEAANYLWKQQKEEDFPVLDENYQ